MRFHVGVRLAQRQANDALRVAEALVHEAMHLQLTLIELHRVIRLDRQAALLSGGYPAYEG